MGHKVGEQLGPSNLCEGGPWRKKEKRFAVRRFRSMGKRMLEDAPKKYRYNGWSL